MADADQEMIKRFIRTHGVTLCPAAVAAPTSATLSATDVDTHRERGLDPVGDIWRKGKRKTGWAAYWQRKRGNG